MSKKNDQKKGKKKKKDIDWSADEMFDKKRTMIYIEHTTECPIFQTKADQFVRYLQEEIPDRMFQLVRNKNGKLAPRPGAFEISISQNARTSLYDIWSGVEKGPPRRDKFPNSYSALMPQVQVVLKKFYAEKINIDDELDEMPADVGGEYVTDADVVQN